MPVALLGVGVQRRRWWLWLGCGHRHEGGRVAVEGGQLGLCGAPVGLGFRPLAWDVAAISRPACTDGLRFGGEGDS